ncbi:MAG: hypothetical protein K2R93_06535 [Gemmatimonadaceae bacterium]|nr:hypothetical protein [Gemmatimonadaceae bacterium]
MRSYRLPAHDPDPVNVRDRRVDTLTITMWVQRAGQPDGLFPCAGKVTLRSSALVRSPQMRWRPDHRGVAWYATGLNPREACP